MRCSSSILCWIVLSVGYLWAADPQPRDNILENGGFESPVLSDPWIGNNWAGNEVSFRLDPVLPHSGSQALHVRLEKVIKIADLQLQYKNLPVRVGEYLRLSFWLRGPANTKPVTVELRKQNAPYTSYFRAEVALTEEWSESRFVLTVPQSVDTKDTCLLFSLKEQNAFWIDDVSLVNLPERDSRPLLAGSQVPNGSFEVGRDHWFATFRETGGIANVTAAAEKNIHHGFGTQMVKGAPHGKSVLSFNVFADCRANVTSAFFPLRYGASTSVSFWLKTTTPGTGFRVNLGHGKFPNQIAISRDFVAVNSNWNFYSFQATPTPATSGTYYLEFAADQPGSYQIDAIEVSQNREPGPQFLQESLDLGWNASESAPAGNLFVKGESVKFRVSAQAPPGKTDFTARFRLVDYRDVLLKEWEEKISLKENGFGSQEVSLPSERFGCFKVEVRPSSLASDQAPLAEVIYSILPTLKPLRESSDSFFGGHVNLSPYNLVIAEKLGFRWLRLHPPLTTKWVVVEPEKGKFVFDTRGPERAHEQGFQLLGTLDTTPRFYALGDPKETAKQTWFNSFAPSDRKAWQRYVLETTKAFSAFIVNWEIWNEPDGGFLRVPEGISKEKVYVDIQTQTREALDGVDRKVFLVGNAVASLDRSFTITQLELGGGKQVDALSFHLYNETKSPEAKIPALQPQLAKMKTFPNRSGTTPEIWHTEGGVWLSDGRSWLRSANIPTGTLATIQDAATALVRTAVALKAMGVHRHFQYGSFADPAGRIVYRDECSGVIDVNGIPHPAGAAHAAAVFMLEGTQPIGLEVLEVGAARVTMATFSKGNELLTVVWSTQNVRLGAIESLDWESAAGCDIMANDLKLTTDTLISSDPIYLKNNLPAEP